MAYQADDNNELCVVCSRIELPGPREDWFLELASMEDALSSASKGCRFCILLKISLDLDSMTSGGQQYIIVLETYSAEFFNLHCRLRSKAHIIVRSGYFELDRPNEPIAKFPRLSSHTASPETLNIARHWLSECVQYHTCASQDESLLPTRVLDCSGQDPGFIRLWVPPPGTKAHYAALSYCWGKAKTLRTTSSTLPQLTNGFLTSDLPKTLRDAVQMTRELGVRYLWIDALCILQGDDEASRNDWQQEAAKMETVYGSAYVTIVAATARHSDEGFLYPRSCELKACDYGSKNDTSKTRGTVVVTLPSSNLQSFKDDPIQSRAWTLQESLLSRRLLICRQVEVIWQCDAGMIHEKGKSLHGLHEVYKYRLPKDRPLWDPIVENYCSRNLTYASDKLLAIAGLARRYHNLTGEKYLAGLWESTLWFEILWRRGESLKNSYANAAIGKPTEYRAPSWSWASANGTMTQSDKGLKDASKTLLKILECKIDLVNPSEPFGMVSGGHLLVRGPLKRAHNIQYYIEHEPEEEILPWLCALRQEDDPLSQFEVGDCWLDDNDLKGIETVNAAGGLYLLLVTKHNYSSIMLIPVPGRKGVFQRAGFAISVLEEQWFEDAQEQTITII